MATTYRLTTRIEERLLEQLANFPMVVNCDYTPRIQVVQVSIDHVIRESLEVMGRAQA